MVKVDEPDEEKAIRMMRGLTAMLEKHHKVRILDEAVDDAVRLSHRYIPDRQLPDKSVSLLDTACARVALGQSATPPALEDCRREIEHLTVEIDILEREQAVGAPHDERLDDLNEPQAGGREAGSPISRSAGQRRKAGRRDSEAPREAGDQRGGERMPRTA